MRTAARHVISMWRNDDVFEYRLRVRGVDLTDVAFDAEIRRRADTPGAPMIALAKVTSAIEGLQLVAVITGDDGPDSVIVWRIDKDSRQALGYDGEIGTTTKRAFAMRIAGQTRLYGDVLLPPHAFGSDDAPLSRPFDAFGSTGAGDAPHSGATLTIAGDEVVELVIDGAGLVGAEVAVAVAKAEEAVAAAGAASVFADSAANSATKLTPFAPGVAIAGTALERVNAVTVDGVDYGDAGFHVVNFFNNVGADTHRITIARSSDNVVVSDRVQAPALSGVQPLDIPEAGESGISFRVIANFGPTGEPVQFFFTGGTAETAALDREKIVVASPPYQHALRRELLTSSSTQGAAADAVRKAVGDAFEVPIADKYLASIVKRVRLYCKKRGHDYIVSFLRTAPGNFELIVRDVTAGTVAARVQINVTDYADLPELLFFDPRNVGGNINGEITAYTGIYGTLEIDRDAIVPTGAAPLTYTTFAQAGLRRSDGLTRDAVKSLFWNDQSWGEVIRVGPGREFTTLRAAVESTWAEGPYADPLDLSVRWCWRATPEHRILILLDDGDYLATNLYGAHNVDIGGQGRGRTRIRWDTPLQRPLLQLHQSNKLFGLTIYADQTPPDVPDSSDRATYGVHRDKNSEFEVVDSVGEQNFWCGFDCWDVDLVGGPEQDWSLFGAGASSGEGARFRNVWARSENPNRIAPFFASHDCIEHSEQATLRFVNCGVDAMPGVAAVALQSIHAGDIRDQVVIENCPTFNLVAHTGVEDSWEGRGDYRGAVYNREGAGDTPYLNFSTVRKLTNASGAVLPAYTLCRTMGGGAFVADDGDFVDAVPVEPLAAGERGHFIVGGRIDARRVGMNAATDALVYVVAGAATTDAPETGPARPIGRAKDGVLKLFDQE
jgi:hypothetical protein